MGGKRDDIMQAALILFSERGYDGTTVPMIADKAHVGAGTIYRYFESKEILVNALFQNCVREFTDKVTMKLSAATSFRDQFHIVFQGMVQFAEEHIHALLFIESHNNAYYLDGESQKIFNEMLHFLRSILDDGKAQGVIKNLTSDALIAIVYGALVQLCKLLKRGILMKSDELINGVEESCWDAIKG
ncbi:MAG: TetR family transcriptional regulator [Paenibacillaceae bacterium]|nr:TetR family transcriptional regulator [Paenibacillaceae bacterium]